MLNGGVKFRMTETRHWHLLCAWDSGRARLTCVAVSPVPCNLEASVF